MALKTALAKGARRAATSVIELDERATKAAKTPEESLFPDRQPTMSTDVLGGDLTAFVESVHAELSSISKERDERDNAEQPAGTAGTGPALGKVEQKHLTELEHFVATNDMSHGLYQKMLREFSDKQKAEYKACKTDGQRREVRMEWAKGKISSMKCSKNKVKKWRDVDTKIGRYMTVEKLAEEYGFMAAPKLACQRAVNYASRCARMGGNWLFYEEWSQSWMILFVLMEHREEFTKAWTLCEHYEVEHEDSSRYKQSVVICILFLRFQTLFIF